MRVSVVINSKAGSVNRDLLERKISEALFRCDLRFAVPSDLAELEIFLRSEVEAETDCIMVCGGDGTLNTVICRLLEIGKIPPIVIVRSGTANDLATEMGVSRRIDRAARAILEGESSLIDLIEIEGNGKKAYMLTNGGLGIPAVTADYANHLRSELRRLLQQTSGQPLLEKLASFGQNLIRNMGSGVYSIMLLEALRRWNPDDWEVEVNISGKEPFVTRAPFILVNNQPAVGSSFKPAPFTKNNDGTVNLLITEAYSIKDQLAAIMAVRSGNGDRLPLNRSFEIEEVTFRRTGRGRPLTFFGDGEILVRDSDQIKVRCLKKKLPLVVRA